MEHNEGFDEMKQTFLSSAISDISTYIQLADTKISIIMGSLIALAVGFMACYEPISKAFSVVKPCSWQGITITIFVLLHTLSFIMVFVFGILTIRGHVSKISYDSKWFLLKSTKEYSFDTYKADVDSMTNDDIIENMAAELYKLNDINRQKSKTAKWTIRSFATTLITGVIIGLLLFIPAL